jgi:hypothetical protein
MWIPRCRPWKSKLCSLGIIDSNLLFVVQSNSFHFLLYTRTTYHCNHPVRLSVFGSLGLKRQFLVLFTLIFIFTSYIRCAAFHCCHWHSFRSKSLSSSWLMDIPNWLLNSIDWIAYDFRKVDIQTMNSQPVVRDESEQMKPPWTSQSVYCKTSRVENSEPTAFLGRRERFRTMSKGIVGLFMSCWCGLFILKSPFRPMSGRLAYHPERFPWSTRSAY